MENWSISDIGAGLNVNMNELYGIKDKGVIFKNETENCLQLFPYPGNVAYENQL